MLERLSLFCCFFVADALGLLEAESFLVHGGFGFLDGDAFGVLFDLFSKLVQFFLLFFNRFLFLFFPVELGFFLLDLIEACSFFAIYAVFLRFFCLFFFLFQPLESV